METGNDKTDLFPPEGARSGTRVINGRCVLMTDGEHRVVSVRGAPCFAHRVGDRVEGAYAMVSLVATVASLVLLVPIMIVVVRPIGRIVAMSQKVAAGDI